MASSFHVSLGDLPSWLLAVFALGALIAAYLAYREQRQAGGDLAVQVKTQGDSLAEQRKATAALAAQAEAQRHTLEVQQESARIQGNVLEAELRELNRRAAAIERQQAEAVVFAPKQAIAPEGTSGEVNGKLAHMAVIRNGSPRPIRDVGCLLRALPGRDDECAAAKVAELTTLPVSDVMQLPFSSQPQGADRLPMIRAGQCFEFRFAVPVATCPDAKIRLRFTDDAGLHWQIDHDLHLEQLDSRDW